MKIGPVDLGPQPVLLAPMEDVTDDRVGDEIPVTEKQALILKRILPLHTKKQSIMKRIIIFAFFCLFYSTVNAQIKEPEFWGEVFSLYNGNTSILEKKRAIVETKAGASLYLFGIGKIKSRFIVSDAYSNIRLPKQDEHKFIVKVADNNIDPFSIISFFKFSSHNEKERRAEISSIGTFTGTSNNNFDYIDFDAEKFGQSSYLLTVPNLDYAEYGIIVLDPTCNGEKIKIISCFGIGSVEEVKKNSNYYEQTIESQVEYE